MNNIIINIYRKSICEMKNCSICGDKLTRTQRKYCSNECKQKSHYENLKERSNSYHSQYIRSIRRKMKLIEMRGGCCERCGYDRNLAAFDFHHKDGTIKESKLDIRILSNRTWKFIMSEFEKCEVLCANCHREEHNINFDVSNIKDLLKSERQYKIDRGYKGKPKCIDCNIEINYKSKRCAPCEKERRSKDKPEFELLLEDSKKMSRTNMGKKYGVSRTTIRRWLGEI